MKEKQIALLELSGGHAEVLYSQTLFLQKNGYKVHLICNESHKSRVVSFDTVDTFLFLPSEISRFKRYSMVKYHLQNANISTLVINTVTWGIVKYLPFMLRGVEIIGITHSLKKIKKKSLNLLLNFKIKKYFVLSDHLLVNTKYIKNLNFSSFYPIFFPNYAEVKLSIDDTLIYICIPGQVEYKRKDFRSLIEGIDHTLDSKIRFVLLGRHNHKHGDGEALLKVLREKKLEKYFIFFDTFIEDEMFHTWLKCANFLMPLPYNDGRYLNDTISGTFNLSYAYKKIQLLPDSFESVAEFKSTMLFYKPTNVADVLNKLAKNKVLIDEKNSQLECDKRYAFKYQQSRYVNFIES